MDEQAPTSSDCTGHDRLHRLGAPVEVFRTDEMIIEAPNWTLDGRWLILNGDGKLWRLAADDSSSDCS